MLNVEPPPAKTSLMHRHQKDTGFGYSGRCLACGGTSQLCAKATQNHPFLPSLAHEHCTHFLIALRLLHVAVSLEVIRGKGGGEREDQQPDPV